MKPRTARARGKSVSARSASTIGARTLVDELNHRVKNNFQIIVSLMNLKKRMMPAERRAELRFIEEHVQAMSVAYRLVYASGEMDSVAVAEVMVETIGALRQISGLSQELLTVESHGLDHMVTLDFAIAVALYLAALLPPFFDSAFATLGSLSIALFSTPSDVTISVKWDGEAPAFTDLLRGRLLTAYATQIQARHLPTMDGEAMRIAVTLEN